jgi:hypothetical protein
MMHHGLNTRATIHAAQATQRATPVRRQMTWQVTLVMCAAVLQTGCGLSRTGAAGFRAHLCERVDVRVCPHPISTSRVTVLDPLLSERITNIAARSPTFHDAWISIHASGVPVSIGTDEQLQDQLPRKFRDRPARWVGLTVNMANLTGGLRRAVIAIRVRALDRMLRRQTRETDARFLAQLDRVLIHEIYGHLTPVVAARDPWQECPDDPRPGEARSCVREREDRIARELSNYQRVNPVGGRSR